MKEQNQEWYGDVTTRADAKPRATATSRNLITTIQNELTGLKHLIVKRSNKMLLEAAICAKDFDETSALLRQTLLNIGDGNAPLYDRATNKLSQEAMRLFYNMPATVLCYFDMNESALKDLQCSPGADRPLTKKEFLLWQLTDKDAKKSEENRMDYFNKRLKYYGYSTLDKKDATDKLVLSLLNQEAEFDTERVHPQNAIRAIGKVLRDENE